MEEKDIRIVKETIVNAPESLLTIKKGATVSVPCQEFSLLSTVKSAATRLNQRVGWVEFEVTSPDNGATIVVRRNVKQSKKA